MSHLIFAAFALLCRPQNYLRMVLFSFPVHTKRLLPLLLCCSSFFLSDQSFAGGMPSRCLEDSVMIDQTLRMQIPCVHAYDEQLEAGVKKANNKLLYLTVLKLDGKSAPLSVSKYPSAETKTIEQAFKENETYRPPNSESFYRILEHGEAKRGGKILRYKITEITFESGGKTNSILYYFMKGDASKELYELKVVCDPERLAAFKELAEKIALSVSFQ